MATKRSLSFRISSNDAQILSEVEGIKTGQEIIDFMLHLYKTDYLPKLASNSLDFDVAKGIALFRADNRYNRSQIGKKYKSKHGIDRLKYYESLKRDYSSPGYEQTLEKIRKNLGINPNFEAYREAIKKADSHIQLRQIFRLIEEDETLNTSLKNMLRSKNLFDLP